MIIYRVVLDECKELQEIDPWVTTRKMSGTGMFKNHSFRTFTTGKILTENNPHQQSDFIMLL